MSYKYEKFHHLSTVENPGEQTLTTTYQEISGSKCQIIRTKPTINLVYKFTFYSNLGVIDGYGPNDPIEFFSHFKLQKSSDNFSSNIVDMTNYNFNFSSDTKEAAYQNYDWYYKVISPFFIIENFDSDYLRLVGRAYSNTMKAVLHQSAYYDGSTTTSGIYYNPNLKVLEL